MITNAEVQSNKEAINDLLEDGVRFREMLALLPKLCGVHIRQVRPNDWRIMDVSPALRGYTVGGSYTTFVDAFCAAMRHVMKPEPPE